MTRRLGTKVRTALVAVASVFAVAALSALHASTQDLTRAEAASMEKKVAGILERGNRAPVPNAKPVRTPVTEREVNAYMKYSWQMPAGLVDPRLTIAEGGRVLAKAIIDLDAIRKARPRGWLDPVGYLTGSVEALASGTLYAANGKGVFQLQSATLGGVTIPKTLLQEIISHYSRTPEHPNGWDMDSPFVLPHNVRQVEMQRGAATIVQ